MTYYNLRGGESNSCLFQQKNAKEYFCNTFCNENGDIKPDVLGKIQDFVAKHPELKDGLYDEIRSYGLEIGKPSQNRWCQKSCKNRNDPAVDQIWNDLVNAHVQELNITPDDCIEDTLTKNYRQIFGSQRGGKARHQKSLIGGESDACQFQIKDTKDYFCNTFCNENGDIRPDVLGKIQDFVSKNPELKDELYADIRSYGLEIGKPSQNRWCQKSCKNRDDPAVDQIWNDLINTHIREKALTPEDCMEDALIRNYQQIFGPQKGGRTH